MPHAKAVFEQEAAASGDLAPPSQLAEFFCLVMVAVIAVLMWRWWQHHSRYEAAQHARDAGAPRGAATEGFSRSATIVRQSRAAVSRTTRSSSSSPCCDDDQSALFLSPSKQRLRRSEPSDAQRLTAQKQHLERLTQLMATFGETSEVRDTDTGIDHARPKSRHSIAHICVSEPYFFSDATCPPSPLAGPQQVPSTSTTPASGPRITSSGSRYTAQLLKRRGSTAEGSVSPISRTLSRFSSQSTLIGDNSSWSPLSRTLSDSSLVAEPQGPELARRLSHGDRSTRKTCEVISREQAWTRQQGEKDCERLRSISANEPIP